MEPGVSFFVSRHLIHVMSQEQNPIGTCACEYSSTLGTHTKTVESSRDVLGHAVKLWAPTADDGSDYVMK